MSAFVTQYGASDDGGLIVEIRVERSAYAPPSCPNPMDLPEDIRRALTVWLAGNQPGDRYGQP